MSGVCQTASCHEQLGRKWRAATFYRRERHGRHEARCASTLARRERSVQMIESIALEEPDFSALPTTTAVTGANTSASSSSRADDVTKPTSGALIKRASACNIPGLCCVVVTNDINHTTTVSNTSAAAACVDNLISLSPTDNDVPLPSVSGALVLCYTVIHCLLATLQCHGP